MAKDLAIARGSLYRAQEENKRLMIQLDRTLLAQRNDSLDQPSPTYDTLSKVEDHLVECQMSVSRMSAHIPLPNLPHIPSVDGNITGSEIVTN